MKVKNLEKKNTFKIVPETEEDLWVLYKIIEPKDIISGFSFWILKKKGDKSGKEKVKVWIKIEVEDVKFHEYSNILRIQGKILEASEVVEGRYYTFNIEIGTEFILEKRILTRYHEKELEKAQRVKKEILICSLDDKEFCIATLKGNKLEVIKEGSFNVSKLDEDRENIYHQKLVEIAKIIDEKFDKNKVLIIISPTFWKEKLVNVINEKFPNIKNILTFSVSKGGKDGVFEFLRRKEYLESLKEIEIVEVNLKIQEFVEALWKGMYTAGLENVKYHSESGAVKFIIISEKFFKKMKEQGRVNEVLELFKLVEQNKGEVYFARENNENYELIEKLGGVVGILRYKI